MTDDEETPDELEEQEHVAAPDDEVETDAGDSPFTPYRPEPRELTDEEKAILEARKAAWTHADPMDVLHAVLQKEPYDRIGRQTQVVRALAFLVPSTVIITAGFLTSGAAQGALFMVGSAILGVQLAAPFRNLATGYEHYAKLAESQDETVLAWAARDLQHKLTGPASFSPWGGIYLRHGKRRWLSFRLNRLDRQYARWVDEGIPGGQVPSEPVWAVIRLPATSRWAKWRTEKALKRTRRFFRKLRVVILASYGLPADTDLNAPIDWRQGLIGKSGYTQFPLNERVYRDYRETMNRLARARESHDS